MTKKLKQYNLYKDENLVVSGPMWKLVEYIKKSQPERFIYRLDEKRIEANLRNSLIRKGKPYGYNVKEVND